MVMTQTQIELETWRNATAGRVVLKRFDSMGHLVDELISGHRSFQVTPQERRLNQDRAANEELDVFANGTLTPVRLIDGEEDVDSIRTNPNLLTDSDLQSLFRAKGDKFVEKIDGINNPATLQRLVDMAYDADASVRQVDALKARLNSVAPMTASTQAPPSERGPRGTSRGPRGEGAMRAVTPK